ncbi:GntR family transcriptional regulator [Affinibrenneria salicis]|uniref:GntR family transcriptional regulator n=1 Tax=Affinibrenneria salicis TaxID=2590031 RepID=A0A5J5FX63_9GAMM|nr:GntR family transcriptional regulator [Affinibrenneria salicis]KAA8998435.1 GntR family transcriptional regulator [Affinibrenneria salicis]
MNEPQGLPLYLRIKNILLKRIIAFSYEDKLPGELVLADEFNVARGTIKQAIDALVRVGILSREQGKGTFINRDALQNYYSDLPDLLVQLGGGRALSLETQSLMPVMADETLAAKMQRPTGSQLLRIERVLKSGRDAVGQGVTWLDGSVYSGLSHLEDGRSLYSQLRETHGYSPVKTRDRYSPEICGERMARLFGIPAGSPLFCVERYATGHDDDILEYSRLYISQASLSLEIDTHQTADDGLWHCRIAT